MKQHLEKYLPQEPFTVNENNWFYTEPKGILLVHEILDKNRKHIKTDQILIPWKKVEIAIKHYHEGKQKQEEINN